mmetsp:Transcript_13328/g.31663  ORF Transcript_13328/g.31663 Transcript_13328/m.31663 type:complete len:86 (+) Transcript_13328:1179-1436(+)
MTVLWIMATIMLSARRRAAVTSPTVTSRMGTGLTVMRGMDTSPTGTSRTDTGTMDHMTMAILTDIDRCDRSLGRSSKNFRGSQMA